MFTYDYFCKYQKYEKIFQIKNFFLLYDIEGDMLL